jgi:hypothetical protein
VEAARLACHCHGICLSRALLLCFRLAKPIISSDYPQQPEMEARLWVSLPSYHWLRASRLNNPPILRVRLAGTFDLLYDGTAISLLLRLRLALARLFRPAIRILE